MQLEDFEIGKAFIAGAGFSWLCTDKGTRTITAIMLDPAKDPNWFIGPPYAVDEVVFDENAMQSCYNTVKELLIDSDSENSVHPGFGMQDLTKMMKEKINLKVQQEYPNKKLLKQDRVDSVGSILHPYAAQLKEDGWYIKTFEIFSKQYSEMPENNFMNLRVCNEDDLVLRKLMLNV